MIMFKIINFGIEHMSKETNKKKLQTEEVDSL
jgi:hypothetical protein